MPPTILLGKVAGTALAMRGPIMDPEDLETTLQCEAIYIPPAARRDDDEDRTLVMAPPLGTREGDLRLVVFGIWAVAALLVALLLVLAR